MITRIIKHNNLSVQDQEGCILKFEGHLVKILMDGNLEGGTTQEHHKKLVEIHEKTSLYFLEDLSIQYRTGTMQFIQQSFQKYQGIELGMMYMDLIGNKEKHSIYGQRYSADTIMGQKIPVAFINKNLCAGIPMTLDQNLVAGISQRAPMLYYPGEFLDLI